MRDTVRAGLAIFLITGLIIIIYLNYPRLNIITGFAAKNICSGMFEAGRSLRSIEEGDNAFAPVHYAENNPDLEKRSVTSSIFGLKKRKAVYSNCTGCTLLPENTETENLVFAKPNRSKQVIDRSYPYGHRDPIDTVLPSVNYPKLKIAVDNAFDKKGEDIKKTRAVLVIYKDHLIAEQYDPEFTKETKLLGWSMTKSITSAVLGILEKQVKISLNQNNLFKEWEKDERSNITLNNLLHMNSGLEWEEDYEKISDVTRMLFMEKDMSKVQLLKPLTGQPGNTWNYSSGTTNLLSGFIRNQFDTHQQYLDFWYKELIDKIGMHSMTLETDLAGNYVGSSYAWATARDWAKFGLLYLNGGNWNGEQILNESWIRYTVTPTKGSNGEYGAHFWLNAGGKYPDVPKDLFSSNGYQGQYVFIIPSKDIVVVRFGLTEDPEFDVNNFLSDILASIE